MPKKSRKIGRIGVRKADVPKPVKVKRTSNTATSTKGNKPGSRQQSQKVDTPTNKKAKQDPRIGDKTPIDLNRYKAGAANQAENQKASKSTTPEKAKYRTPQDELDAIENNAQLDALLEKQAEGRLTQSEQTFVDKMTTRYRELCELMGIEVDEYDEADKQENTDEVDPFASLDAIKLDDYKD
jgi:ribosome assembly protein YihI (activator of Der GTPase)